MKIELKDNQILINLDNLNKSEIFNDKLPYKVTLNEKGIFVFENKCWICGSINNITNHHALAQHLNPINNVEIPVCDKCHKNQHGQSLIDIKAFSYRVEKLLEEGIRNIPILKNMISKKQKEEDSLTIANFIKK